MRRLLSTLWIAVLLGMLFPGGCQAEILPHDVSRLVRLAPADFDGWCRAQGQSEAVDHAMCSLLERAVLGRLKTGAYTSDEACLDVLRAWSFYDNAAAVGTRAHTDKPWPLLDFRRAAKALLGFVGDRPLLEAKILYSMALELDQCGDTTAAAEYHKHADELFKQQYNDVNTARLYNLLYEANAQLRLRNVKAADALYEEVLDCPWFATLSAGQDTDTYLSVYKAAVYGLIQCRRGNSRGLKQIYIYTSMVSDLKPVLDEAVSEAAR